MRKIAYYTPVDFDNKESCYPADEARKHEKDPHLAPFSFTEEEVEGFRMALMDFSRPKKVYGVE